MYKVCILAAGYGSRVKPYTDMINKALLPYMGKAVISHIIEKFDKNTEFIIIVGYQKDSLIDYLKLAHPELRFTFVIVDNYGIGPGYSLSKARELLQCPFYLSTVDCIVEEEIHSLEYNWIGISNHNDSTKYVTVNTNGDWVQNILPKTSNGYRFAYIGLSGIKDYIDFWKELDNNKEFTESYINLVNKKIPIKTVIYSWKDTGCIDEYNKLCLDIDSKNPLFLDELTYIVNQKCIKIITNNKKLQNKVNRQKLLPNTPLIQNVLSNGFSYQLLEGNNGYDEKSQFNINDIINWYTSHFQINKYIDLRKQARKFYYDKTIQRLLLDNRDIDFFQTFFRTNEEELLNCSSTIFHGDFTLSNIILNNKINIIDWRECFDTELIYGDRDYDLAKLYMSILIPWDSIKLGNFSECDIYYKNSDIVRNKVFRERYLTDRIAKITGIVMINMSPLYINTTLKNLLFKMGTKLL